MYLSGTYLTLILIFIKHLINVFFLRWRGITGSKISWTLPQTLLGYQLLFFQTSFFSLKHQILTLDIYTSSELTSRNPLHRRILCKKLTAMAIPTPFHKFHGLNSLWAKSPNEREILILELFPCFSFCEMFFCYISPARGVLLRCREEKHLYSIQRRCFRRP